MYCSQCGGKIPDNSKFCQQCGSPVAMVVESNSINKQELHNEPEPTKVKSEKRPFKIAEKILYIICKVFFAVAIYTEVSSILGYAEVPILLIGSLLLILEFLVLAFAFPKNIKGIKITSLLLSITEIIYAVGIVIYNPSLKGDILLPIMCLTNAVVWAAISLKLFGKPLHIFEKVKPLYIIVPLLKPFIFLIIKMDLSGALLWAYAAFACALVGYFVGYEKLKTDYSEEECIKHQKSTLAGVLLIVFFPVGVFLLWKNKCFNKILRIVGTVLSAIWFPFFCLLLIGALIPCEHNWVGGSCTEVAVCDICGEEAENPTGHVVGDWSEWDIDYDKAKNVREKICSVCEEVVDTETEDVTTFINDGVFAIYPNAFADRFEEQSGRLKNIDYATKSEYAFDMPTFDEENYIYYRIQDKNDDYKDIGLISFTNPNGKDVSVINDFSENSFNRITILIESASDVSAMVYSSILAIDPSIDYDKAADVGQEVVDNIVLLVGDTDEVYQGTTYNNITYILSKSGRYHYLVIETK